MKKRVTAVILSLLLAVSLLAVPVAADEGAVEFELLADDGSTATATLTCSYETVGTVIVDGETVTGKVIVTDNYGDSVLTVDKSVTGTGYLGADPDWAPGSPLTMAFEKKVHTSAGSHALRASENGAWNTDSPFFGYLTDEYGEGGAMMLDLLAYTAPDGSRVFICPDPSYLGESEEPGTVKIALLADDGSFATATLTCAHEAAGSAIVDGETVNGRFIVVDDFGSSVFTVDKPVSGKGYMGDDAEWTPESEGPLPFAFYRNISTSAGEHRLISSMNGAWNTDSPFFGYVVDQQTAMMLDLICYTDFNGRPVYVIPDGIFLEEPTSLNFGLLADDGTVAEASITGAYETVGSLTLDGEKVSGKIYVVDDIGISTLTVDKPVSGKGYLGGDPDWAPGTPLEMVYEKDVPVAAGEHPLMVQDRDGWNTDSPFFDYAAPDGASATVLDLLVYTYYDGTPLIICPSSAYFGEPDKVEFALLADDGSAAAASLTCAYEAKGSVILDGKAVTGKIFVVDDLYVSTLTVDKPVSGKGYLGGDPDWAPGAPLEMVYEKDVPVSAGDHPLRVQDRNGWNTDGPFFDYAEPDGSSAMVLDLLVFTAPDGTPVIFCPESDFLAEPEPPVFSDVPDDWSKAAIDFMAVQGYMNGTGDGTTFSPNEPMTYGMALTIMARVAGIDTAGADPWYQPGIDWGTEKGLYGGEPQGSAIQRQDLLRLLWLLADAPEADLAKLDMFADKDTIRADCRAAVAWAAENEITTGAVADDVRVANPASETSRAEYAAFVMRAALKDLFAGR